MYSISCGTKMQSKRLVQFDDVCKAITHPETEGLLKDNLFLFNMLFVYDTKYKMVQG